MPALVDSHVHANEPGRTHWEGLRTLTAAAAAGGIGTVVDMPLNCIPATVDVASLHAKRASCPKPSIDVTGWGGAVGGRLDDLPALLEAGAPGAKAFMIDSGVAEFPALTTDNGLAEAMTILAAHDKPLLVHAEDADIAARTPLHTGTHRYADLLAPGRRSWNRWRSADSPTSPSRRARTCTSSTSPPPRASRPSSSPSAAASA